jgi:hypothetical protein
MQPESTFADCGHSLRRVTVSPACAESALRSSVGVPRHSSTSLRSGSVIGRLASAVRKDAPHRRIASRYAARNEPSGHPSARSTATPTRANSAMRGIDTGWTRGSSASTRQRMISSAPTIFGRTRPNTARMARSAGRAGRGRFYARIALKYPSSLSSSSRASSEDKGPENVSYPSYASFRPSSSSDCAATSD